MTKARQDGSSCPETNSEHPVRAAFDRVTRWFGNLLAPLVIITYARDAQEAFDYLIERPLLTGSFALIFILVLAYNVLRTMDLQLGTWMWWRRRADSGAESSAASSDHQERRAAYVPQTKGRTRTVLRWTAILGSLLALVLVVYAYVSVFVTGLHYVAVASAPDKASATREIRSLNRFFQETGHVELEARAHGSTASGTGWYMISVGGPHRSRGAAEATFRKAKQVMGPRMRPDAYIYSTEHASPTRVIRNRIRGLWRRLFG
jgi:hypothetical protein